MSGRTKTHRKSPSPPPSDASGNFVAAATEQTTAFLKFLDNKTEDAFTRPWHRLERGLRLNRLRLFTKQETERFSLSEKDQAALFSLLTKALDKKFLNSKTTVIYDQQQQKILEIKGLTFHTQADGKVQFQFSERRAGVTMKKKREDDDA